MNEDKLAALLSELLSDEDEEPLSNDGENAGGSAEFDLSAETQLFEEAELEAALSRISESQAGNRLTEDLEQSMDSQSEPTEDPSLSLKPPMTDTEHVQEAWRHGPEKHPEAVMEAIHPTIEDSVHSQRHSTRRYRELDAVEASVRKLSSSDDDGKAFSVLERIKNSLSKAEDDWNPEGRPDAQGGMIGGSVVLRVSSTTDPLSKALQNEARYGTPSVICERPLRGSGLMTAVGTSRGLLIVQVRSSSVRGGHSHELFELSDARGLGTIRSLAFSHFSDKDKLLLAVGTAEGVVSVWDIGSKKCIATITGHVGTVHCLNFLTGRTQNILISSDTKGAMHCHTLTSWVVRTAVSTRVLSEGNKQPLLFRFFPTSKLSEDSDDTTATSTDATSFGEGMVCLCHPNVCSIGRLLSDGRLVVFYQIPKPVSVNLDVLPIAVWSPMGSDVAYAPHPNPDINNCIPLGTLALCWERQICLLRVPLLGDPSPDVPNTRHLPHHLGTSDLVRLAHEVHITSAVSWESSGDGQIMYACWLPTEKLGVIRRRGILSQLLLFNSQLEILDQVEIDDCPVVHSLRTEPSELNTAWNTVSPSGAVVTALGSMAVKECQFMEWADAVAALVSIEKWMMATHLLVALYCQSSGQSYHPKVGVTHLGARDITLINKMLSSVLVKFLDWMLQSKQKGESASLPDVAELLVDVCILNKHPDILFDELFPRFVSNRVKDIFLEKLEKSLTSNELKARVPPEVMQSLVEYCCEIGQPDKIERCVLRMDISSLDLNQVCQSSKMKSAAALLFIFNHSLLRDCTTPARYLVNAVCYTQDKKQAHDYGMKLLLYMRCCLFGESYPPGIEQIDEDRALITKQQILGFVLFTTAQDLKKASRAMAISSEDRDSVSSGVLMDPYPVLRCLLSVHSSLIFHFLRDALEDWECMEKDLLEAFSGGAVEEMESVRSVTQVIVDALVELMQKSPDKQNEWIGFLCHCVASGRAVVDPSTALKLLEHLSASSQSQGQTEYVETEQESQFCGIVQSVGVELDTTKSSTVKMTYLEGQKALGLALNANLLLAAAKLYHLFQDYKSALEHYIKAGNTASGGCFAYFEASVAHFVEYRKTNELKKMKSAVLSCMSDLACLNPESAASMVMRHFPDDQEAVIQGLHGSRDLLFKYLKSSMEVALTKVQVSLSSDTNQLLTKSHCTLYVNLMCEYDPTGVLPFLKTFDHLVDVQQCKKDCLDFGLKDAAAHLLEREGDVVGALKVLIEKIQDANKLMERSILSRSLDNLESTLSRQLSLSAILRVSSTPDARLNQLPDEICASQSALSSAVMLCRRNSLERGRQTEGDEGRREETMRLWFALLTVYIDAFRNLPRHMKKVKKTSHVPSGFYSKGIIKSNDQFHDYPRLAFLRDTYAALMDEVITAMADYVPLIEVAELIINEHGQDRFGDFRSTLLSLINAYNYEQNILTSISKLLSADAFRVLMACHKKRSKAIPNPRLPVPSLHASP